MTTDLGTYLNDHLAGSSVGTELARRLSEEHAGAPDGPALAELTAAIEQDRDTLAGLMERLGVERSVVKQAGGWVAEKLTRVKLSDKVTGSVGLRQLLEFETLAMGVQGKRALWLALREVREHHPELAATDLDALVLRADEQVHRLEELRLAATRAALQ